MSAKVAQTQLDSLDDDAKTRLTQRLAETLNTDIALDVEIIPVTSVTKKQAKELSPEQKIHQRTQEYLDVLYNEQISTVSVDYYTDKKRFAVINVYTETSISNKEILKIDLYTYLQEQEDLIDIIILERTENVIQPEKKVTQQEDDTTRI